MSAGHYRCHCGEPSSRCLPLTEEPCSGLNSGATPWRQGFGSITSQLEFLKYSSSQRCLSKLSIIQLKVFKALLYHWPAPIRVFRLRWMGLTISRSSLLLKRPKEKEHRNAQRDVRRSIDIATIIEARDRQRGAIAIARIDMIGREAGIETATEAGTIALGSTILTRMVTVTSALDTREETAKMTPRGIGTGIGIGGILGKKSQASLHLQIRRRSFLRQTKRYLETRPHPWREIPG